MTVNTVEKPITESELVEQLLVDALAARLIATDIDDTLVANGGMAVSAAIQRATETCRSVDIAISVVTGRSIARALPIIRSLRGFGVHVVANGAAIIDNFGNVIDQHNLNEKEVVNLARVIGDFNSSQTEENEVPIYLPGGKQGVAPQDLSPQVAQTLYVPIKASQEVPLQFLLSSEFGDSLSIYPSDSPPHVSEGRRMLNIGSPEATKRAGLRRLLEIHGVSPRDTVALGDGVNDIPLFETAGTSIAVANGDTELLGMADYIVPSQYMGGGVLAMCAVARVVRVQHPHLYGVGR